MPGGRRSDEFSDGSGRSSKWSHRLAAALRAAALAAFILGQLAIFLVCVRMPKVQPMPKVAAPAPTAKNDTEELTALKTALEEQLVKLNENQQKTAAESQDTTEQLIAALKPLEKIDEVIEQLKKPGSPQLPLAQPSANASSTMSELQNSHSTLQQRVVSLEAELNKLKVKGSPSEPPQPTPTATWIFMTHANEVDARFYRDPLINALKKVEPGPVRVGLAYLTGPTPQIKLQPGNPVPEKAQLDIDVPNSTTTESLQAMLNVSAFSSMKHAVVICSDQLAAEEVDKLTPTWKDCRVDTLILHRSDRLNKQASDKWETFCKEHGGQVTKHPCKITKTDDRTVLDIINVPEFEKKVRELCSNRK